MTQLDSRQLKFINRKQTKAKNLYPKNKKNKEQKKTKK